VRNSVKISIGFLAEIGGMIGYAGVDDTREIVPSDAWVSGPVGGL
jgi:hypothetical protein